MARLYPERDFQFAVKQFADLHQLPMLHIANEGRRSPMEGARLKKMGMHPGASDCFFLRSNENYKGLWLELKIKPNKPTPNQLIFLSLVIAEGYQGLVSYDLDHAFCVIREFYGIK